MNRKKRGLALLLCICMLFTLMPMAAFADGTSADVVYGSYDKAGTTWTQSATTPSEQTYANTATGANVKYSKTAAPSSKGTDYYDITLKIESETNPGVSAVVLAIDKSKSMGKCATCNNGSDSTVPNGGHTHAEDCETGKKGSVSLDDSRFAKAIAAAKSFASSYAASGSNRYLAVVFFAGSANPLNFADNSSKDWWEETEYKFWLDVSNAANLATFNNKLSSSLAWSTNLASGLSEAKRLFALSDVSSVNADYKFTVALTDGANTAGGDWYVGHDAAAKNAATSLKSATNSNNLYAVCYSAGDTVSNFLKNDITGSSDRTFNANNTTELNNAFTNIVNSIKSGLSSGFTVTDPMGGMVTLDKTSLSGNGCTVADNGTITWTPTTGTTETKNGKTIYTYTLTYTVKLNTEATGFENDTYYPTNGNTTLSFKDGNDEKTLQFNVPGVKGVKPTYNVTYQYDSTAPDGAALPDPSTVPVQKDAEYTVATPTAVPGYTFNGWKTSDVIDTETTYAGGSKFNMPDSNVTLVGSWTENPTYGVTYKWADSGNVPSTVTLPNDTAKYEAGATVNVAAALSATGWTFKGWTATNNDGSTVAITDGKLAMLVGGVTITGDWEKNTYSVKYEYTGTVPAGAPGLPDEATKAYGTTVDVATAPSLDGYTFSGWTAKDADDNDVTIADGKFNMPDSDVTLKGSFTPQTGLSYTVNYYLNGTTTKVVDSKTVYNRTYGEPYTESPIAIDGYTAVSNASVTKNITTGENVINFYYYENVTLKANSDTRTYNGEDQILSGFTGAPNGADFSKITVGAIGKNVGTYPLAFNEKVVGTVDQTRKYIVTDVENGTLTITARPLKITGASLGTVEYDGQEHKTTDYTADNLVAGHKITGLTYLLTGTNANNYKGNFDTTNFKIEDADGKDVTANYKVEYAVGELTITQSTKTIKVTITGNNATKTYTGKELSVSGYECTVTGAEKSQISVALKDGKEAVAKGTNVGTYYMNLSADMFNVTSQNYSNIEIAIEDGWLKIEAKPYTPPTDTGIYTKITVKITGNSASEVYDGTEKSVEGYTVEISDPRYTEKDFKFTGTAEAKGTFVGEYPMGLEADQFVNINRRFKNVEFIIVEDGVLTITARPITITAGSAEGWVTDCPITCDEWTSTPPAPGDTVVSVKITGVQNGPGSSPNVPSDAVIKNEAGKDVTGNYDITYVNGLLVAKDLLEKEDHFNYVIGYPDGSVQPNGNITRAEVATIFYRLLTDEARAKYTTTDNSFSDIKAGEWYTKAIATLENANIIGGYPDGTFKPNAPITRAEMATIIAKFANLDENGKSFTDIKGHWAQSYVELAAGNGWINGYEDGTFRPDKYITRAETFTMINRVLDRQVESADALLPTSQMNMWTDNLDPTQWYYMDVQEATNYHKCDRVNESKYETWTEKVPDIDWAAYQY